MNRGSMSKQISTAPKSKSKKVKKMAFGGLTPPPGFQQAVGPQQAIQQGTQVTAAGTQMDRAAQMAQQRPQVPMQQMAQMQAMEALQGRGGQPIAGGAIIDKPGALPKPDPRFMGEAILSSSASMPRGPRPGMGDMPPPMLGRGGVGIGKPGMGPRPGMGDMPRGPGRGGKPPPMVSQPGTGRGVFGGGPGRGGPAPMPAMATPMKKGGAVKKAKGGKIDGCCMKGHTKARMK